MVCAGAAVFVVPAALAQQQPPPVPTPTPSPARTPSIITLPGVVPERYSLPGGTPVPLPTAPPVVAPVPIATPTPSAARPTTRLPAPRAASRPAAPPPAAPERPPQTPAPVPTASPVPAPIPTAAVASQPVAAPAPSAAQPGMPGWLWMLFGAAATAMLGAAAWFFFLRHRPEDVEEDELLAKALPEPVAAPLPRPSPPPSPPRPAAAPSPPPAPSRSDPFEIDVRPARIALGEREVTLEFELLVGNTQPVPADGIRIGLAMISASPDQDRILAAFHRGPPADISGEPFDLASGSGVRMPLRLVLPRERVHVVQVAGRPMFVAMVLVDLRWRSGLSIRRFGADFMVGAAGQGARLGPIWLDRGSPTGPLGATRYLPREAVAA